ncbi:carbohydrate-binding module family 50 protein [Hydnomerulius pinastri MD-312]|uniref:Carbohydrate-binding module family 50 protein n=1 Tax=Hydnomerulius pinastri MD-312 TaxID=994086 RepID=A0A0C9VEY5_9AGAM|nr:carbohydrate-binding module family 50 protein [Hydnomerulius pinastri MD-312]
MFTKAVATLLALPFVAQLASAQTCTRTYTIQEGDICDSISAAQNVSTYQLAVVNINTIDAECNNLSPGASLCLGWQGEDCSTTYVVKKDDTCDDISGTWGVNNTILYMNNPQINEDCSNIYVGEVLCTSTTVQVPPAPAGSVPVTAIPPTATPANPDGNGGDDDLPWCDEDGNPPSATPAPSSPAGSGSPTAPAATPSPTNDDDDDCDDE